MKNKINDLFLEIHFKNTLKKADLMTDHYYDTDYRQEFKKALIQDLKKLRRL